jgi:hypothetical protein
MPVPVPRINKPPAHPVIKPHRSASADHIDSLQNLTRTLPVSPTGPPPSFGTREQWINSLPSWRRLKPRRIWEDDAGAIQYQRKQQSLSHTADPSVVTGARLQTCISPHAFIVPGSFSSAGCTLGCDGDADDEMSSDCSAVDLGRYEIDSQSSASSPAGYDMHVDDHTHTAVDLVAHNAPNYERGAFTPVFEEDSATLEVASSPLEPVTPFGQFVDRAVAAAQASIPCDNAYPAHISGQPDGHYSHQDQSCPRHCHQIQPIGPPMGAPTTELIITPSASDAYKKLAEPLASWMANYVWKACTTGMSLPAVFAQPRYAIVLMYISNCGS